MTVNKRQGYTHYRSKRRYEDAQQARNVGEVEINFGEVAQGGDGVAPLSTGEMAGSGINNWFRLTSGDEVDCLFRLPADFDATATSTLYLTYSIASSTATAADTITPLVGYQIPVAGTNASGLGDAASSEGITNPTAITLGAGIAVGALYEATATISSASSWSAGDWVHLGVETKTTCANDTEARLLTKATLKYAKDYL